MRVPDVISLITHWGFVGEMKDTAEIVNASDVLQDDDELAIFLRSDTRYMVLGWLRWQSNNTPDLELQFTGPSGASLALGLYTGYHATATFGYRQITAFSSAAVIGGSTGVDCGTIIIGSAETAGAAGMMTLQWAQDVSNASNTTIYAQSFLVGIPLE